MTRSRPENQGLSQRRREQRNEGSRSDRGSQERGQGTAIRADTPYLPVKTLDLPIGSPVYSRAVEVHSLKVTPARIRWCDFRRRMGPGPFSRDVAWAPGPFSRRHGPGGPRYLNVAKRDPSLRYGVAVRECGEQQLT